MTIEAGGDILVHRMVQMAAINASDAIIIKRNVVASELSAGKNNMLVAELGYLIGTIHKQVEAMIRIISQLQMNASFKANDLSEGGLQPLIMVLLEKRFKELIPSAKKYVAVTKKGEKYLEDEDWHHISVAITQIFLTLSNQVTTLEKLTKLSEKMKKMHEFSEELVEPDSYIIIPSALDSRLYCSGDVTVNGQGCVNTKIHAGGKLQITGILRGGKVYGRMGADIEEAGSASGSTSIIAVPADQIIRINTVHEGTKIAIGNNTYVFREMKQNVTARLNKSGRIVFG